MTALQKIIAIINLIYWLCFFAFFFLANILAFVMSTVGVFFLLLLLVPIIWGAINSVKCLQQKGWGDYPTGQQFLLVIPLLNVSLICLMIAGVLFFA